ncbi:MAG: hypothetical protein WA021_01210, partial [Minisyncoccia bacterium]
MSNGTVIRISLTAFVWLLPLLLFVFPEQAWAITTSNAEYTIGEVALVTCSSPENHYYLYDSNGGSSLGEFTCIPQAAFGVGETMGQFMLVEIQQTEACGDKNYAECRSQLYFVGEITFEVGDESIPRGSGGSPPSFGVSKSQYSVDEVIVVTCDQTGYRLQLFDVTFGYAAPGGVNFGNFECTSQITTISFDAQKDHLYALIELGFGSDCGALDYQSCMSQMTVIGETSFTTVSYEGVSSNPPEVTVLYPRFATTFSREAKIEWKTVDANDFESSELDRKMGLGEKPVSLYYSQTLDEWDGALIPARDKVLITRGLPANGTYTWDTSKLTPGTPYRIIVEGVDKVGEIGQDVSDFVTVDFEAPTFIVTANPPATRGEDVTITIESSKELPLPPEVLVTQTGAKPVQVDVVGDGIHYRGLYKIVRGYDGLAKVTVNGIDVAGNKGSLIVSGGTFGVGIQPPPKSFISAPRDGEVVSTSTVVVSGEAREDTIAVISVNGIKVAEAQPNADGIFSSVIPLRKDVNRGVNIVSVALKDQSGILGAAATVRVKFNIPPTATLVAPEKDAHISDTASLETDARDENIDALRFTYEILSAQDYDPLATTTNVWTPIAEAIPTNRFSWNTAEVEDGKYYLRVTVDDGIEKVTTEPHSFTIRNTLPFFRFEDGRRTIVGSSTGTVVGRAIAPQSVSPRPTITKIEYSRDNGTSWRPVTPLSGMNSVEAYFSVPFARLAEGVNGVLWRVTDSRGFVGRVSHPIILDRTPPAAPVLSTPREEELITNVHDANPKLNGMQIVISGRAESQGSVILSMASGTRSVKTGIGGDFVFRDVAIETRGEHEFSIVAIDMAGNRSKATTQRFVYDNPPDIRFVQPRGGRGFKDTATIDWRIQDLDGDSIQGIRLAYRRGVDRFSVI